MRRACFWGERHLFDAKLCLKLMPERIFGDIPGYPEGSSFASGSALSRAGVHRPIQAGISGSAKEGTVTNDVFPREQAVENAMFSLSPE